MAERVIEVQYKPNKKQELFHVSDATECVYGGAKGGGKALEINTIIPTPFGWTTMGELQVGDMVFGEDGQPVYVLAVSDVMYGRPCYKVTFEDSSEIIADAEHLWKVFYNGEETAVLETQLIAENMCNVQYRVINYKSNGRVEKERCIVSCEPVESVPVKCIKVAGNGMFLAGRNFIPTHNSCALVMDALGYALQYPGATIYLFREDYDTLEANLIKEWKAKVPADLYSYHESKHTATIKHNGSKILFRYLSDETDAEGYQGREMDYIGIDELTKHTERTIQIIQSCMRSAKGFPVRFRGTCNPGGKGHGFVKERYVKATNYGEKKIKDPVTYNIIEFIPASVYDNDVLMQNDPSYVRRLENLPEAEKKAFLYGDWDVFMGQAFSEWRRDIHVVKPFDIPPSWPRIRALDWGFSKPFAVYWGAVDFDGVINVYREFYGCKPGCFDVGVQQTAKVVAKEVKRLEQGEKISNGVADPAIWAKTGHESPTIADEFMLAGVYFNKANNDRLQGKMQLHQRLQGYGPDRPGIKFFDTCEHAIRTIPALCYDKTRPEDIDSTQEDHCFVAGTKVLTKQGNKNIEEITVGDEVLTRCGYQPVLAAWMTNSAAEVYTVTFSNNSKLVGTGNHPVWVIGKGFIPMERLCVGDPVLGNAQDIVIVESVQKLTGKTPVYNITVDEVHEYFANGILVHNCYDAIRYMCMTRLWTPQQPAKQKAHDRWGMSNSMDWEDEDNNAAGSWMGA